MKLILKLAWRNIWRNRRRSLLTLLAITFATFLSITMRGVQKGMYDLTIKTAVETFPGYIQIQSDGFQENNALKHNYRLTPQIEERLSKIEHVKGFAPRIISAGLISYKTNSQGTAILGVAPDREKEVSKIIEKVNEGNFFQSDTSLEIVLGSVLLEKLNAQIGENVVLLAQGFDGSMGNLKFKIIGTVKLGVPELDGMAAFIPLQTAQELVSLYNRVQVTAISIDELSQLEDVKEQLDEAIEDEKLAILSWHNVIPDLKQSIELDNISGIFFLAILIIIVTFGILNTVLMSVTERFNEFGVSLAVGMPNLKLSTVIIIETFFIVVLGLIFGNLIGYGIVSYLYYNPYLFTGDMAQMYEMYGFVPKLQTELSLPVFLNSSLIILIISLVAAIYPVYKVLKLEALKGIRYT